MAQRRRRARSTATGRRQRRMHASRRMPLHVRRCDCCCDAHVGRSWCRRPGGDAAAVEATAARPNAANKCLRGRLRPWREDAPPAATRRGRSARGVLRGLMPCDRRSASVGAAAWSAASSVATPRPDARCRCTARIACQAGSSGRIRAARARMRRLTDRLNERGRGIGRRVRSAAGGSSTRAGRDGVHPDVSLQRSWCVGRIRAAGRAAADAEPPARGPAGAEPQRGHSRRGRLPRHARCRFVHRPAPASPVGQCLSASGEGVGVGTPSAGGPQ